MDKKYDWCYENSITLNKEYIDPEDYNSPEYSYHRTNTILSNYVDTIMIANQMNISSYVDSKLQYDYYFYSVRPKKRFFKRKKSVDHSTFKLIQDYYKYNDKRTHEVLLLLTEEQINFIIKNKEGGIR